MTTTNDTNGGQIEQVTATATPGRVGQATAVEQSRAVAEVQAAIVVAQQMPRRIDIAREEMRTACQVPAMAEQAFYRFPRGGQTVSGASVHLARELARCFGNIDYGIHELRRDDEHGESEMKAWAWDQQLNTRSSNTFIVPHRRDKRGGSERLTDARDIYENNANMGARRLRETIFSILPRWFTLEAEDLCRRTLEKGDGTPLPDRIAAAIVAFEGIDVDAARLERKIGRASEKWTTFDLAQLTTTYRSIQRGEISADDEFPVQRVTVAEIAQQGQSAQPVPSPTPAAESTPDPEQTELVPDPGPDVEAGPASDPMTTNQAKALHALLRAKHGATGEERFPILSAALGRKVTSTKQISNAEAGELIEGLQELPDLEASS